MSAKAKLTRGSQLSIGTAGDTPTFTAVEGVASINIPGLTKDEIEVTDLNSTAKEFIDGLGDAGELSFEILLEPGTVAGQYAPGQEALKAAHEDGGNLPFRIALPAAFGITYEFDGFVRTFSERLEQNDAARADVTIRVSGEAVRVAA